MSGTTPNVHPIFNTFDEDLLDNKYLSDKDTLSSRQHNVQTTLSLDIKLMDLLEFCDWRGEVEEEEDTIMQYTEYLVEGIKPETVMDDWEFTTELECC